MTRKEHLQNIKEKLIDVEYSLTEIMIDFEEDENLHDMSTFEDLRNEQHRFEERINTIEDFLIGEL